MITGYRELQDGTLEAEDEAGNLLLISSEDMSGLLGSLEDIFPEEAWKLKKDFKKFSDTVLEQNQKILFEMYKECRAFFYWSANGVKRISEALARYKPQELSCAVFETLQLDLLAEQNEIRESRSIPPLREKVEYSLLKNGRSDLLEKLKREFSISFQIEEADEQSTRKENPFAKMTNIRMLKLAVVAEGAEAESLTLSASYPSPYKIPPPSAYSQMSPQLPVLR